MYKIIFLLIICGLSISTSFAQYKTVKPVEYKSQYDPESTRMAREIMIRSQQKYDNNRQYIDNLIDWIFDLKTKTNDEDFIYAMNVYYKKLRSYDDKDLGRLTNDIRNVELSIKEEIYKYNSRLKMKESRVNDPQTYWNKGNGFMENKNYSEAIENYNKVIDLTPNYPDVYYNRGFSYFNLQKFQTAIEDLTKYIEFKSDNFMAYGLRGWCKYYTEDFIGAIQDFNNLIELNPDLPYGYFSRALAKSELNDYYGAISDYKKTIELKPNNSMAYNNMGWTKFRQKKYSEALIDVNKAIELDNKNATAYDSRAEIKFNMKDYEGCINDARMAIELDSKMSNSYFLQGRALYRLGNKQKACEYWSKAGELGKAEAYEYISKYCN